jgi:hypothetical protein
VRGSEQKFGCNEVDDNEDGLRVKSVVKWEVGVRLG